jgi:hypothetical protein
MFTLRGNRVKNWTQGYSMKICVTEIRNKEFLGSIDLTV